MKKGKHVKKTGSKVAVVAIALALVCCMAVGGTLAWLADKSETVTNTFTTSDVSITLTETKPISNSAKMIPGYTIEKNPLVKVGADSEPCYVFVKVVESENFDTFMEYEMAEGWEAVSGETGVYVWDQMVPASQEVPILKGDVIKVKDTVTKSDMEGVTANPTLEFVAYAVQYYSSANTPMDLALAWEQAKGLS